MTAQDLKNSILQQAIQGKLTRQLPTDGNAKDLLEKIRSEKLKLIAEGKLKKEKPLPPISEDEKPFDIPDSWTWVRLGEIAFDVCDGVHNKPEYTFEGIPFLSVKDISDGYLNFDKVKFISKDNHEELKKRCYPRYGDLLITKVGSNTGIPVLVDTNREFSLFVSVSLIKYPQTLIYPKYFLRLIQSPLVQKQVAENTKGIGHKNWVIRDIKNTLVILPPLEEQKRIVAKLEELLPLVEKFGELEQRLTKLDKEFPDKLKKSLLQQAIQGKLTRQLSTDGNAKDLLEKIREEKLKLVAEGKLKKEKPLPPISAEEIPFDIPDSWQWVRLGEICNYIQRGKSPKYSPIKKYPVVAQKCNQLTGFSIDKAKFIEPDSIKSYSEEKFLQDNDLLWNSTGLGTVGRMAIYDSSKNPYELAVADSHVTVIRILKSFIDYKFIFYYITSPAIQKNINSMVSGSTKQKELATQTVKELLIPLPPLEEQKRIVAKLEELLPLCDRLNI